MSLPVVERVRRKEVVPAGRAKVVAVVKQRMVEVNPQRGKGKAVSQ